MDSGGGSWWTDGDYYSDIRECERKRMGITIIFKIAAVGIIVTILGQVLKHSGREEQAFLLSLAGLIIVLFWIVPYISELFQTMETLFMM